MSPRAAEETCVGCEFRRRLEKTDPDQFELAPEDLGTGIAAVDAEEEVDAPAAKRSAKPRAVNRGAPPKHPSRIEEVVEPESLLCGNDGCLYFISDDVSERPGILRVQFRAIVTRRPLPDHEASQRVCRLSPPKT